MLLWGLLTSEWMTPDLCLFCPCCCEGCLPLSGWPLTCACSAHVAVRVVVHTSEWMTPDLCLFCPCCCEGCLPLSGWPLTCACSAHVAVMVACLWVDDPWLVLVLPMLQWWLLASEWMTPDLCLFCPCCCEGCSTYLWVDDPWLVLVLPMLLCSTYLWVDDPWLVLVLPMLLWGLLTSEWMTPDLCLFCPCCCEGCSTYLWVDDPWLVLVLPMLLCSTYLWVDDPWLVLVLPMLLWGLLTSEWMTPDLCLFCPCCCEGCLPLSGWPLTCACSAHVAVRVAYLWVDDPWLVLVLPMLLWGLLAGLLLGERLLLFHPVMRPVWQIGMLGALQNKRHMKYPFRAFLCDLCHNYVGIFRTSHSFCWTHLVSRGSDLLSRALDLLSRALNLLSRAFDLLSRALDLLTRAT